MPDDTITLVSTTDSPEEVQAALTNKPVKAQEPAPDTPAPETPETPETPEPGAAETEAEETPAERQAASEAGRLLAKRKNKIQEQIDAEIRRKHEARLDAEAEEARLHELRRQRLELERQDTTKPAVTEPPAQEKAPAGRPEPKLDALDADGKAKYATYEDYLSDHAVWTKEEAILATRKLIDDEKTADRERIDRESSNRVVQEHLATYNEHLEAFKKTHVDFDAVFQDAKDAVQETLVAMGPNALKVIDGYTVFDAEDGPALTYHLLKHPDELKAIALKAPPQQLVALARLEERIRPAGAKRTGPSAVAAVETRAPAPIKPVGSGPTATTVSPDEESYQDYKTRRNRELRTRQGL